MKRNYYILQSGRLKRQGNTLYFISGPANQDEKTAKIKKPIPVNDVEDIFVFGELDLNSKLLDFLAQNNIPIHFFNYYGFYSGSYIPREYLLSGFLLVNQVKSYLDNTKRIEIAKEFIAGAAHNTVKNLIHYQKQEKSVETHIECIKKESEKIILAANRAELMGTEGRIKKVYYESFNEILRRGFPMKKRVKQPPDNMINCLISFGNALLYNICLSEIYHTQLNPTVSYLHEPSERRYSLALDISEVFKPTIVDKTIFKLVNNGMIDERYFMKELNFCYLNNKGRRVFLESFDKRLKTVINYPKLNRELSYRSLIRQECYRLIKHLVGGERYESFTMWW
jgi:CRISPR-associated protein Cas1